MNHSTKGLMDINYTKKTNWIIPIFVNILLIISVIWIILSLIHNGIKNNKWKRAQRNNYEKLSSGWIYTSVLLCAVFCFLRYVFSLVSMIDLKLYDEKERMCRALSHLKSFLYTFIHLFVWLFLWLRQYTIYSNRMLALSYSKLVRYFSFAVIVIILISGIAFSIFSVFLDGSRINLVGCIYLPRKDLNKIYWVFVGSVFILVHGILFGLFAHALIKSRSVNKQAKVTTNKQKNTPKNRKHKTSKTEIKSTNTETNSVINRTRNCIKENTPKTVAANSFSKTRGQSSKQNNSKKKIKLILKKTFWFAVISVILEIVLPLFIMFMQIHERLIVTSYNIMALLNLLLVIFSFFCYKNMLFSFFC